MRSRPTANAVVSVKDERRVAGQGFNLCGKSSIYELSAFDRGHRVFSSGSHVVEMLELARIQTSFELDCTDFVNHAGEATVSSEQVSENRVVVCNHGAS